MFFLFTVQISLRVLSCIVGGSINLKFGGVRDSLILNMNGEDRIWSPRKSSFNLKTVLLFPDFKREYMFFSSLSKFNQRSDPTSSVARST